MNMFKMGLYKSFSVSRIIICLSVHPFGCLSLSVCISICLRLFLSLFASLSLYPPLSLRLALFLSVYLTLPVSLFMSVFQSVCLPDCQSLNKSAIYNEELHVLHRSTLIPNKF